MRPRSDLGFGEKEMDPSNQTRIFFLMMMVSLLFAAQLVTQTGALAALP